MKFIDWLESFGTYIWKLVVRWYSWIIVLTTVYALFLSPRVPSQFDNLKLSVQGNNYILIVWLLLVGFSLWQEKVQEIDHLPEKNLGPDIKASIESAHKEHLYGSAGRSNQIVVKLKIWNQGDDKGFVSNVKLYGEITNTKQPYELIPLSTEISTQDILKKRNRKEVEALPTKKPTFPLVKGEPAYKEYLFLLPFGVFIKPKKIGIYRQYSKDVIKLDLKDPLPIKQIGR